MLAGEKILRKSPLRAADQLPTFDADFQHERYFIAGVVLPFLSLSSFSRASGGGRYSKLKVYEWLSTDVPRIDHSPLTGAPLGLLAEESRINSFIYSDAFSNSAWTKIRASISNDVVVSPDGFMRGDKIVEDTQAGGHNASKNYTIPYSSGVTYALSLHVKSAERTKGAIQLGSGIVLFGGSNAICNYDLSAATATKAGGAIAAGILSAPSGWGRPWVTGTAGSSGSDNVYMPYLNNGSGISYTGDGVSGQYIFGAQNEIGAFPTSYIPTTTSAVARAIDFCTINLSGVASNPYQWTWVFDGTPAVAGGPAFTLDDETANNRISCVVTSNAGITITVVVAGATQATLALACTPLSGFKLALSFAAGVYTASVNGGTPVSATAASSPTTTRLVLMSDSAGSASFNGHCRRLKAYRRQYLSSALQALSA